MKIVAVCGSGLGSSLLVEMNIRQILDEKKVEYESEHTNISSFMAGGVDWVVCGIDVAPAISFDEDKKIVLKNILSKDELRQELTKRLKLK